MASSPATPDTANVSSSPPANASHPKTVSTADTQEAPQKAAQPQQAATDKEQGSVSNATTRAKDGTQGQDQATDSKTANEMGNVLNASPAANSGQTDANEAIRNAARAMVRKRWDNPKPPAEPAKAQASAHLNSPKPAPANDLEQGSTLKGGIKGLSDLPKDWPKLAGNVSLGVELAWVQANRLAVVKELPSGGVKVDLAKAYAPAPSMAALSWLETSIRSYAKFIEVASKQASSGQDEAEFIRKERMAIGEIRGILAEMMVAKEG